MSIILYGDQLIFTRVEAAYSPKGRSGYQTVCASVSLTPDEIRSIEKRVQCFQPSQSASVRYQFFVLESGRWVLTHTRLIAPHPEIIDKTQRPGVFSVRCLVLDPPIAAKARYDPLAILEHCDAVTDPQGLVERFHLPDGPAPAVEIALSTKRSAPSPEWAVDEIKNLTHLAMEAKAMTGQSRSLLLLGKHSEIAETLHIAIYSTPEHLRQYCTFDTHIERCPVKPGDFWAMGASRRPGGNGYIEVNVDERRIIGSTALSREDDFYGNWLGLKKKDSDVAELFRVMPTMQVLATAFAGCTPLPDEELDDGACAEFFALYEQEVIDRVQAMLCRLTRPGIGKPLAQFLHQSLPPREFLALGASPELAPQRLDVLIVSWLQANRPQLAKRDWQFVEELARQTKDMRLLHWSATFNQPVRTKIRDEALTRMDDDCFQATLTALLQPVEPVDYLDGNSDHLQWLLQDERLSAMSDEQFVALVKGMLARENGDYLEALVPRLESTGDAATRKLIKIVAKAKVPVSQAFAVALNERDTRQYQPAGFFSWLFPRNH